MKKVLIYCLLLLLILALFPAFAILITDNNYDKINEENKINTENKADSQSDYSKDIVKLALEFIEEDFCDESIKAILAIAENNFYYNKENNIKTNYSLKQTEQNVDLEKKAEKLYKESDIELSLNKEKVYIPAVNLSSGNTKPHKDYPYIKSVASPWDCISEEFVYGKDYSAGVSLNGIDYLCKNGMSCKEALSWYLPDFDIK